MNIDTRSSTRTLASQALVEANQHFSELPEKDDLLSKVLINKSTRTIMTGIGFKLHPGATWVNTSWLLEECVWIIQFVYIHFELISLPTKKRLFLREKPGRGSDSLRASCLYWISFLNCAQNIFNQNHIFWLLFDQLYLK